MNEYMKEVLTGKQTIWEISNKQPEDVYAGLRH